MRSEYRPSVDGDGWRVLLPAEDDATVDGIRHLPAGRWSLSTQDDTPVHVAQATRESMFGPDWQDIDGVKVALRARHRCHRLPADRPCRGHPAPGLTPQADHR